PITSLSLQLQLTRKAMGPDGASPPPERMQRLLQTSDSQLKRLTGLVEDLLDVSRIQEGKLTMEVERDVDLSELFHEVCERFAPQLATSGSLLFPEIPPRALADCDRFRMDQVIVNLLSNAIKYGQGQPIHVRLSVDESRARFEVEDGGI